MNKIVNYIFIIRRYIIIRHVVVVFRHYSVLELTCATHLSLDRLTKPTSYAYFISELFSCVEQKPYTFVGDNDSFANTALVDDLWHVMSHPRMICEFRQQTKK